MPKMQVYLPQDLYERVKARGDRLNVSSVLQSALASELAALERQDALDDALRRHEAEHGAIGEDEVAAREAADRRAARRPGRRRGSSAA